MWMYYCKQLATMNLLKLLLLIYLFLGSVQAVSASEIHSSLLQLFSRYERPVTILYISPTPKLLDSQIDGVVVYWTQSAEFVTSIKENHIENAVVVTKEYDESLVRCLAECEHFDICILDNSLLFNPLRKEFHLADYTFILDESTFVHKNKTLLKKNIWQGISGHNNYFIHSDFMTKFFVKPKEYIIGASEDKRCTWLPGINLCTFMNLKGIYPSRDYLRSSIIELLNPYTHFDFTWGNIILQGLQLRAIDYKDTVYSQNPNDRLRVTLEKQLGMTYK